MSATLDPITEETLADVPILSYPRNRRAARVENVVGFLVSDAKGRVVGRVEGAVHGASPIDPSALSVRFGVFRRRRCLVPADAIAEIDGRTRVIGLGVDRQTVKAFPQQ